MEIISDIPLRRIFGRDFSAVAYAADFFYLVNGQENKAYKCNLSGNFICSYSTRIPLSSLCYNTREHCFIGVSSNLCNRILFYDSSFSRMDVCYLPLNFCSKEPIAFVKYDDQMQQTLLKKGDRWLLLTVKKDAKKIYSDVSSAPNAICNLTAVCCQAILIEKIDVLSGTTADGSYYDLTLPPGYSPKDLCIVEVGTDIIIPALIAKASDGSSRLVVCRITKEYGQHSPSQISERKKEIESRQKVSVTLSQLLISLYEITFTVTGNGSEQNDQPQLSDGNLQMVPFLGNLQDLLYLSDLPENLHID